MCEDGRVQESWCHWWCVGGDVMYVCMSLAG
jgi:hypothetical protein